jgi:hypothetical protein
VLLLLVLAAVVGWASSTPYQPPEGGDEWQSVTVVLTGTAADANATGKAVLACNMAESQHRIQLAAQKLVARGTYSVWLAKYSKEGSKLLSQVRVDDSSKRLRADGDGKLALAANLSACPQGRYTHVVVRYHADGNPKRVSNIPAALMGEIP